MKFIKDAVRDILKSVPASIGAFLMLSSFVYAASTIGANIVTTGTLEVTGISTLTGDVTSSGIITGDDVTSVDDVTAGDDLVVTDDATISGRSLVVTTTNSSTSTIQVGCIQTTATSTTQPIKLNFVAIATSTASFPSGSAPSGYVTWSYGTCP